MKEKGIQETLKQLRTSQNTKLTNLHYSLGHKSTETARRSTTSPSQAWASPKAHIVTNCPECKSFERLDFELILAGRIPKRETLP